MIINKYTCSRKYVDNVEFQKAKSKNIISQIVEKRKGHYKYKNTAKCHSNRIYIGTNMYKTKIQIKYKYIYLDSINSSMLTLYAKECKLNDDAYKQIHDEFNYLFQRSMIN